MYSRDSTERFVIKAWEDEAVTYDLLSGDTHLLEFLACRLLNHLKGTPLAEQDLVELVSAEVEADLGEVTELIGNTISQLLRIEIIVSV